MIVLGMWIALQLFSGSIAATNQTTEQGGIAYVAHVGGFAAGIAPASLFEGRRKTLPAR